MKLFSGEGKPIKTAPPGNDGSKLPVVKSLSPGAMPVDEVPAALNALSDEMAEKYGGIPTDLRGGRGVDPDPVRHGGIIPNPRLDLSQYRRRVPIERPVQFEVGEELIIEGCKFKIVYIRSNPSRMTLEAI